MELRFIPRPCLMTSLYPAGCAAAGRSAGPGCEEHNSRVNLGHCSLLALACSLLNHLTGGHVGLKVLVGVGPPQAVLGGLCYRGGEVRQVR